MSAVANLTRDVIDDGANRRLKVLVVLGTRPEAVKLAPVVMELRRRAGVDTVLCATGQHREMLDQVLRLFQLTPDHDLDLMRADQQLADITSGVLSGVSGVIIREKPDVVVVQGDTTTAMAGSLAAFFHRVPVGHVEAGLRTGLRTSPFPEELMRRMVGRIAELHFAPTTRAAENLRREGADTEGAVYLTGNTVVDAVRWIARNRPARSPLMLQEGRQLLLVTAHRRENFGQPIRDVCDALRALVSRNDRLEIVYPVHPNPNISGPVHAALGDVERIRLVAPLDYSELVDLMRRSVLVLTDSGGLQEEAPVFGKPVLVLRNETERPEAVEAGTAMIVGTDPGCIVRETERLLSDADAYDAMAQAHSPFGDGFAALRIVDILEAFGRREADAVAQWRWVEGGALLPYPRTRVVA